jgi:hypothetical protein
LEDQKSDGKASRNGVRSRQLVGLHSGEIKAASKQGKWHLRAIWNSHRGGRAPMVATKAAACATCNRVEPASCRVQPLSLSKSLFLCNIEKEIEL